MEQAQTYAHSPGARGNWHPLASHLTAVADLAGTFAADFGHRDLAYAIGLWHDLGKANPAFQEYLRARAEKRAAGKVPHAIWGAALAYRLLSRGAASWKAVAMPMAGHHTGLHDGATFAQDVEQFLAATPGAVETMARLLPSLPPPGKPSLAASDPMGLELLLRMLTSCLVDADYLDTECHFTPGRTALRGQAATITALLDRLRSAQAELMAQAQARAKSPEEVRLNDVRREVYEACLEAAGGPQGVYRLTVPTGGGKTRSSLAFALAHAQRHGLRRVVVAIPYTSIIDQTAADYRDALGEEAVLEHHSHVAIPEDEEASAASIRARLAAENWDKTVIVTTTVQLFESLFANGPGRLRKLHNLARSVIVLDEVQTLPTGVLVPTLDVLRALVDDYGVTLVLCTATQPALDDSPYLKAFTGMTVREIVPQAGAHFVALRRVDYDVQPVALTWKQVAEKVATQPQVMVVLNTRRDAINLLAQLPPSEDVLHLSTLLCGAHRRERLAEVKDRLDKGAPITLVTTQVVEAGVNLDFPVVWRAVGPLDRIVQAAGRCNREGKLAEKGRVVIFQPAEGHTPPGPYAAGLREAQAMLRSRPAEALHRPETYREYFRRLYAVVDLDEKRIQPLRRDLDYPEVARRYHLIEETLPVVVPYGDAEERLSAWRGAPSRETWRRLQPYLVSLRESEVRRYEREGLITEESQGLYRWQGEYDHRTGIAGALGDPADLGG